MKLSPRLQAIADWIEKGARLADIGTDHGMLPIYCVLNGITDTAAACDIKERPLLSARRNARAYGIEDRITFLLGPGLEPVDEGMADTIVAAGMGGETIRQILSGADWIRNSSITLLLQPQSKIMELRQWLGNNGFSAERARLVRAGGRIYLILRVHWDGMGRQDEPYYLHLLDRDELIGEYASHLLTRTEKQLLAFDRPSADPDERRRLMELCDRLKQISAEAREERTKQ